jgi:hypothetical protein
MNPDDYHAPLRQTMNPSSRVAFATSYEEIVFANKVNFKNFTYNVCNEVIMTIPTVFYLRKNSYLTRTIDEKIDDLNSAGLTNFLISKYLDPKYLRVKIFEQGPRKLRLTELGVSFKLLGFGILISIVVFVFEIVMVRVQKSKYLL